MQLLNGNVERFEAFRFMLSDKNQVSRELGARLVATFDTNEARESLAENISVK